MYPTTSTETFSVQFPPVYESVFSLRGNIMAEHKENDICVSYINISLQELTTFNDNENGIYTPFRAVTGKYASLPPSYNSHRLYPELAGLSEQYEKMEQLEAALEPEAVKPEHGINSYVFKQHGTPEIEAVDRMKGKPDEWMVLLRVGSDDNPGFCFLDAGEIYFVIHKSDLDKKDFSNVYCGLESS